MKMDTNKNPVAPSGIRVFLFQCPLMRKSEREEVVRFTPVGVSMTSSIVGSA